MRIAASPEPPSPSTEFGPGPPICSTALDTSAAREVLEELEVLLEQTRRHRGVIARLLQMAGRQNVLEADSQNRPPD